MAAGSHLFFGISPGLDGVTGAAVLRTFGAMRETGFASAMFRFATALFSEVGFSFVFIAILVVVSGKRSSENMVPVLEANNGYPIRTYAIKQGLSFCGFEIYCRYRQFRQLVVGSEFLVKVILQ